MANYNNADGFKPISFPARANKYTTSAAVTKGDAVAIVSGKVLPFADGTHTAVIGVAAESASAADAEIMVFDDPNTVFYGQTAGSYAPTSHDGVAYSLDGATGAQAIDQSDTSGACCTILGHYPVSGSTETGNYARVKVVFTAHVALG